MKKKRICLFSFALALMLAGCGILRPGPEPVGRSSPVTLEISVDPSAPGGIAFTWSEKAAEMLEVTVTSASPDSPEITIRIRPQPAWSYYSKIQN